MAEQEPTWSEWFKERKTPAYLISAESGERTWKPTDKDREAAWVLYTEIRTRITTQPLHFRSGDEETALASLHQLFDLTRTVMKDKGAECGHFATITVHFLNTHVRPLTAKWHKKAIENRLANDDDRREFRQELSVVRNRMVAFCKLMGAMAEGEDFVGSSGCERVPVDVDSSLSKDLGEPILFDRVLFDDSVLGSNELYLAEKAAIRARRNPEGPEDGDAPIDNLVGLACSGGGIRSATFCLGVAQSLASHGLLPRVDYLSTVSGGGYFGAFLSSYLNDPDAQRVGLEKGQLPFEEQGRPESTPIRQLRNNSKYLLKGGLLGQLRIVGLLLVGILVNLLTLMPVIFGLLTLTKIVELNGLTPRLFHDWVGDFIGLLLVLLALFVLGLPAVYRWWGSRKAWIERYEKIGIRLALILVAVWALGWALPWLYRSAVELVCSAGTVIGFFAVLPFLFAGIAFALGIDRTAGRVLITLAGITGPLLLLMVYMALNDWTGTSWVVVLFLLICALLSIPWLMLFNLNWISLHRYYRKRLAETYLLRRGKESAVDPQPLSELCSCNERAPYHLINAAVNLPGSKESELRGRNADFFLLSRHFCGSPLLGYAKTGALEQKDPRLDLGTAMALSGAAASAHMGAMTFGGFVFWMSLLNIRLGYWLPNPRHLGRIRKGAGVRPFSLWSEIRGGLDESKDFVNLSDGGHIENLGVYELLRRRCKLIIAIDGEADPNMACPSLMRLIRYAQIDFGIRIEMDLSDLRRDDTGFTKAHFALGKIDYGKGLCGYLLYIKSSLTGNERGYIRDYRRNSPGFPHESTADQFFSEAQFEAYRALGEHIGDDLFLEELAGPETGRTFESWFSCLVCNLQEERIA